MKRALAQARNAKGAEFERFLCERALDAGAAAVRRRFVRAGGLDLRRVDGEDLGDVDVLVATATGRVLVIEAKSLEMARTPRELANEVRGLSVGPGAAASRVGARCAALRRHRRAIETALGLPDDVGREFVPLVVTDRPLLGSLLNESDVPICSVADLGEVISADHSTLRRRR